MRAETALWAGMSWHWSRTDRGAVRRRNEDALLDRAEAGLCAVADGLGGHESGDLAATMLCAALEQVDTSSDAEAAVRAAVAGVHAALLAEAARRGPGVTIASTIVVLLLQGARFVGLWAGDSRLYRLRHGRLERLSTDHSLVQEWVAAGRLAPEQADDHPRANIITRAVGIDDPPPELDRVDGTVRPGDRFLLCSDGLHHALGEAAMAAILGAADDPAAALIAAALRARAQDNVTAVVVQPA